MRPASTRDVRSAAAILLAALSFFSCVQPLDESSAGGRPPVIASITAEPNEVRVGTSSTITVQAEDPEGGVLTYRWAATTGDIIGDGPSVRFTASFCCTGTNFVRVTVRNSRGGVASASAEVLITY